MSKIHMLVVSSLALGLLTGGCSSTLSSTELVAPGTYLPGVPQLSGPVPEVRQVRNETDSRVTTTREPGAPLSARAGGVKR